MEYDLFPTDAKSLRIGHGLCSTIASGQDEPSYEVQNDKINEALEHLEMIDLEPDGDFDLVLQDSDDDEDETSAILATKRKKLQKTKKKSRKIMSLESF